MIGGALPAWLGVALFCGAPEVRAQVELVVQPESGVVKLGRPFTVRVIRRWPEGFEAEPFADSLLFPLSVLDARETRELRDGRVEQTLEVTCLAFALQQVELSSLWFVVSPPAGGAPVRAGAGPVRIQVETELDPADPGPLEWPEGPLSLTPRLPAWWPLPLFCAALAAWLAFCERKLAGAPARRAGGATVCPAAAALLGLAKLRQRPAPRSAEEVEAYHVEVSAILREYLDLELSVAALSMTTEEVEAASRLRELLELDPRLRLGEALRQCDFVKFARQPSDEARRERLWQAARELILETATRARTGATRVATEAVS